MRFEDGWFKVLRLAVGAFYLSQGGVLYPVEESLQPVRYHALGRGGPGAGSAQCRTGWGPGRDGETGAALAQTLLHPIRSAEGLAQLPTTVALLIASSPEYFARFGAMSSQDQIREAARLSTHLLMMYGGAAGTAGTVGRIGGLGVELPVVSLTAEGELALSTVLVPTGTVTTRSVREWAPSPSSTWPLAAVADGRPLAGQAGGWKTPPACPSIGATIRPG